MTDGQTGANAARNLIRTSLTGAIPNHHFRIGLLISTGALADIIADKG